MQQIQFNNVYFKYPKSSFEISVDSLTLNCGEICIFYGLNGSGKSTLFKLCLGILKAQKGSIKVFDLDVSESSLGQIGKYVGYLFQEPSKQLFTTSVWDEITFIPYLKGVDTKVIQEKAVDLLKKFNLYHLKTRSIYRLSRGEKQRLAIACILMNDIKYLILDEPTTGLDKENRYILYTVINQLLQEGIGVSVITHDNELKNHFKDARFIKMENGKICLTQE